MLEIWLYAFSIMYSPGPVNLLSFNTGLNNKTNKNTGFFMGVSFAMLILFLSLSFLSHSVVHETIIPYISILGCTYMLFLSWKLFTSGRQLENTSVALSDLKFRDGLMLQLLNPKGFIACLPIVTIQFPAQNISGLQALIFSIALSVFAFGAPLSYSLTGRLIGQRVNSSAFFKKFQLFMAILLAYVAMKIAYTHIYIDLFKQL
ncbi:LysE family translocator [Photobacterium halotolerans]|uniref:LysE family translocator n=1 Tax=Photobacterium halotolerans TaxID=265726 RepID=UPI0004865AD4|nr:LysE family transporter [Photobacterium halotolerans]